MDDFFKFVSVVPYAVPEVAFPIDEWVVAIPFTGAHFVVLFCFLFCFFSYIKIQTNQATQ